MFRQSVLETIDVINHSAICIRGEKRIYIDPIKIQGTPHDADLILFTHPHFDHFSPKDVKKLLKHDTVIAAPESMKVFCKLMLRRETVFLLPDRDYELCGVQIHTVAAYNNRKPMHMKAMKWLGYIIDINDTKVYISGDTDITEDSRSVSCDIAILPVGGFYTINAVQAAELARMIAPHTVIPVHYGKFLGGGEAAEKLRSELGTDIETDIRPNAYSTVLVSMYAKLAVIIAAVAVLELHLLEII